MTGPCQHLSSFLLYATVEGKGSIEIEVCANPECAHIVAMCEHIKCTWNDNGSVLTCDLCGVDAT